MAYILYLGVIDVPYNIYVPDSSKRVGTRTRRGQKIVAMSAKPPSGGKSTGDVAGILEDKYHIIEVFVEDLGIDLIEKAVVRAMGNAISDLFSGAPVVAGASLARDAFGEIEEAFRLFIDQKELDGTQPGVPTAAALAGVNHRLKHPYAKSNPARPSFRDAGLYQASFRVWDDAGA